MWRADIDDERDPDAAIAEPRLRSDPAEHWNTPRHDLDRSARFTRLARRWKNPKFYAIYGAHPLTKGLQILIVRVHRIASNPLPTHFWLVIIKRPASNLHSSIYIAIKQNTEQFVYNIHFHRRKTTSKNNIESYLLYDTISRIQE